MNQWFHLLPQPLWIKAACSLLAQSKGLIFTIDGIFLDLAHCLVVKQTFYLKMPSHDLIPLNFGVIMAKAKFFYNIARCFFSLMIVDCFWEPVRNRSCNFTFLQNWSTGYLKIKLGQESLFLLSKCFLGIITNSQKIE